MRQSDQKMKKYLAAVRRRLALPADVKKRVMNDLVSSIHSRREAGKSDEAIFAELGTPAQAAKDLNEQMKDFAYRKSPWRWACMALVIVCILVLIHGGVMGILSAALTRANAASLGIIGGADGPTAIFVATSSDYVWYQYGMTVLLLILGLLGFVALSRLRKK